MLVCIGARASRHGNVLQQLVCVQEKATPPEQLPSTPSRRRLASKTPRATSPHTFNYMPVVWDSDSLRTGRFARRFALRSVPYREYAHLGLRSAGLWFGASCFRTKPPRTLLSRTETSHRFTSSFNINFCSMANEEESSTKTARRQLQPSMRSVQIDVVCTSKGGPLPAF